MFSKITNPLTGRKVLIDGRLGRKILRKYLNVLNGGAFSDPLITSFPLPSGYRDLELWIFEGHHIPEPPLHHELGHLGFSFDRKNLDDVDKKIYGFGPIEPVRSEEQGQLFMGKKGKGKVTDDTHIFRDYPGKIYVISVWIKDDLPDEVEEIDTIFTYGLPAWVEDRVVHNCITYAIETLKPITYTGGLGEGIDETGYTYINGYGGNLTKFLNFFYKNRKDSSSPIPSNVKVVINP